MTSTSELSAGDKPRVNTRQAAGRARCRQEAGAMGRRRRAAGKRRGVNGAGAAGRALYRATGPCAVHGGGGNRGMHSRRDGRDSGGGGVRCRRDDGRPAPRLLPASLPTDNPRKRHREATAGLEEQHVGSSCHLDPDTPGQEAGTVACRSHLQTSNLRSTVLTPRTQLSFQEIHAWSQFVEQR